MNGSTLVDAIIFPQGSVLHPTVIMSGKNILSFFIPPRHFVCFSQTPDIISFKHLFDAPCNMQHTNVLLKSWSKTCHDVFVKMHDVA